MTVPSPRPGELYALGEQHYRFGLGPILFRVLEVLEQVEFDGTPWWKVNAEVANGTHERHGGWSERCLYVEAAAIPRTHRQQDR